jgi:uncharacterized protein (DUF2236 family)
VPNLMWRGIRLPARQALWIGGVGLLSPVLRERFGLSWSRSDERMYQALGAFSRSLTPVMPRKLRIMGPAQLRWRQAAISRGPLGRDAPAQPARARAVA